MSNLMIAACRKCTAPLELPDEKFCPRCGTPTSMALAVRHRDAVDQFSHHNSVLQNYRAMFIVSETFSISVAATRLDDRGLVMLFAAFGISWVVIWIFVTTLRARVVEFFEKHDEDGALMQYHNLTEGVAHRAGFWIFTILFPTMFAVFWLILVLLAYGTIRIG